MADINQVNATIDATIKADPARSIEAADLAAILKAVTNFTQASIDIISQYVNFYPGYSWNGTKLKLKNPDGTWGPEVDLQATVGDGSITLAKLQTTVAAQIQSNSDNITRLLPTTTYPVQVQQSSTYALSSYDATAFKDQRSWYFGKSAKTLAAIGVMVYKKASLGTISNSLRVQVLHSRSSVVTVLLDRTIAASALTQYNADSITDYRNFELRLDLDKSVDLVAGDGLFIDVNCESGLNPIYCNTNTTLSTGEWNDSTGKNYRSWSNAGASTLAAIPTLPAAEPNPHAIFFYSKVMDLQRVKTLETGVANHETRLTAVEPRVTASETSSATALVKATANETNLNRLVPTYSYAPQVQQSSTYAFGAYDPVAYKDQRSWYFGKSAKSLQAVGVFIYKKSTLGTITNSLRVQVLHSRSGVITVLLDRTIAASALTQYNADSITDYRNFELRLDLDKSVDLVAGDGLFIDVNCESGLNPIYCNTNTTLSTGEWNDSTGKNYRSWSNAGASTLAAIPTLPTAESNPHAIIFYTKSADYQRVIDLETKVSAMQGGTVSDYEILTPANVYYPNNAINGLTSRKEAVLLYLQHFLKGKLPLYINKEADYHVVSKEAVNVQPVEIDTVSFTIDGGNLGTSWPTKTVAYQRISVNTAVLADKFPKLLYLGDSITENRLKNGQQAGAGSLWAMAKEIALKNQADNNGSGYNFLCVGNTRELGVNNTFMYKGASVNLRGYASGMGGWSAYDYLRHPFRMKHNYPNGAWDLLGLSTQYGRAYNGSFADAQLIKKQCWGINAPVISGDAYNLLIAEGQINNLGAWTNSDEQNAAVQNYITSVANGASQNPFFDINKMGTNRFSIAKYLERHRTLAEDGVTRLTVGSTAGTRVTNAMNWDCCMPTHVVICLGENDRTWMGDTTNISADILELANEWLNYSSTVQVAFCLTDIPGDMWPERHPWYKGKFYSAEHSNKWDLYKVMQSKFGTLDAQKAARFYLLPTWFTMQPLSHMIVSEQIDEGSPTGRPIMVGVDDAVHPGYYANRSGGAQLYGWVAYTQTA